jgi:hypothetical protein
LRATTTACASVNELPTANSEFVRHKVTVSSPEAITLAPINIEPIKIETPSQSRMSLHLADFRLLSFADCFLPQRIRMKHLFTRLYISRPARDRGTRYPTISPIHQLTKWLSTDDGWLMRKSNEFGTM